MVIVFALAAAVLTGSADFLGGAASRRRSSLSILAISAPAGALLLLVAALVAGGPVRLAGLPWAAVAGAAGGSGLIIFYAALAAGPMRLVAPVAALTSTALPVGVAIAGGERPGPLVYLGGGVCLLATVLVSVDGGVPARPARTARGLVQATVAGIAFGCFYLCMRNAGATGVLWPGAVARLAGAAILGTAAAWAGAPPAWRGAGGPLLSAAVAAGVLDATANLCYLLAIRAGLFGVAVVLTSLYPAVTVLLARLVLGERMRPWQLAGLLLAVAGIAAVGA